MGELAARLNADDTVPGSQDERAATQPRRITADSFRALTARLKKSADAVQHDMREQLDAPPAAIAHAPVVPTAFVPEPVIIAPVIAAPPEFIQSIHAAVSEPPPPLKPEVSAKSRADAHAFALEAIAKLRKAAGAPEPQEPAPTVADAPIPEVIPEAAIVEPPTKPRRPHPFIPDLFLDDDEDPAPAVAVAAVEETIAEAPVFAEIFAIPEPETEAEPELKPEIEPEPEVEQPAEQMPPALQSLYEESEIEVESAPPPLEEILAVESVVEEVPNVEAEAEAAAPELPAEDAGEDEALLREQNELIEDEADAVHHLRGVEVIGIGEIAKSIFRNPTAAERAEYLAEAALLASLEDNAAEAKDVVAVELPDDLVSQKPQVRKAKPADDPFARIAEARASEPIVEPDEDAAELARSLLDMMLSNPSAGLPQERALAADALLKLVPRVPAKALIGIVERLSIMESPPHLLIAKLIADPRPEIAGPLLEQCNHIGDQLLSKVIATGQINLQRLIARRRHLSSALTDELIDFDDPSVVLTLVRNAGAVISHQAFRKLAVHAAQHHQVLAPLSTRADLPAPIAFELFWHVPAELRRYLLSRFLTDSETLTKILKITNVMDSGSEGEAVKFADAGQLDDFVSKLERGEHDEAITLLASLAAISEVSARRITGDRDGEPLAIAMKAIGANRAQFEDAVERWKASDAAIIDASRQSLELQNVFEQMSFNKARVLLTYWDWAALKSGPYSTAH